MKESIASKGNARGFMVYGARAAGSSPGASGGADFRTMLGRLFTKPYDFLRKYADPNVKEISLEGIGTFKEKNSPAFQMAASIFMTNIEAQLNASLNYLEFVNKTLPQMIERSLG